MGASLSCTREKGYRFQFGFQTLKLQFQAAETLVSLRRNHSFTPKKLQFQAVATKVSPVENKVSLVRKRHLTKTF